VKRPVVTPRQLRPEIGSNDFDERSKAGDRLRLDGEGALLDLDPRVAECLAVVIGLISNLFPFVPDALISVPLLHDREQLRVGDIASDSRQSRYGNRLSPMMLIERRFSGKG